MDGEVLSATFVELADTLVADFDVIDFLHVLTDRSVQLLGVSAAGLLLADPRGELRVVAASSEAARLLELFQLQSDQGPCLDCFRAGQPVDAEDLAAAAHRWPRFVPAAQQAGFAAVQALPMRLREQVIGALDLFRATPGALAPADRRVGQALADVATISLLHERSTRRSETLNEQLQTALNSRVIIEQANGKLAERPGLHPPARPGQGPQPPPVRPGPGVHRRHRHPHRPGPGQVTAAAAWRRAGTPPAPAGSAAQAVDLARAAARRRQGRRPPGAPGRVAAFRPAAGWLRGEARRAAVETGCLVAVGDQ